MTQNDQSLALQPAQTMSSVALLMDTASLDRIDRIAEIMSSGKSTVPAHLRGNKGDCFAITMQSMTWGMNPFAVAQKTHLVNGVLGYEAQLVSAVINASRVTQDRFHFEWFGSWEKIVGKFKTVESRTKKDDEGNAKKFIVPDWNPTDEQGLGVRVWATLAGEKEPRVLELLMTQARTRNSTLWTEDPKQQIAYLAQKRWSRLYAPDVILGVYTPDELEILPPKDMGMADVVGAPTPAPAPTPAEVEFYPQASFDENLASWTGLINSGRKTADTIITTVNARGKPLTEAQKTRIKAIGKENATDATMAGGQQQAGDTQQQSDSADPQQQTIDQN